MTEIESIATLRAELQQLHREVAGEGRQLWQSWRPPDPATSRRWIDHGRDIGLLNALTSDFASVLV